jgi:hypothetical protein
MEPAGSSGAAAVPPEAAAAAAAPPAAAPATSTSFAPPSHATSAPTLLPKPAKPGPAAVTSSGGGGAPASWIKGAGAGSSGGGKESAAGGGKAKELGAAFEAKAKEAAAAAAGPGSASAGGGAPSAGGSSRQLFGGGGGGSSAGGGGSSAGGGKEVGELETIACGSGGVDEMRRALPDESLPYFGMLRLTIGEGTYAREKTVLVHYSPDACPGVKKAKASARKPDVRRALGDVHSDWLVTSTADLAVGPMLEAMKHMASDSTKGGVDIKKMKADYEAMIASSAVGAAGGGKGGAKVDIKNATGRLTAAEMPSKIPSHAALKAVRDVLGPFNWALFAPSEPGKELEFVNAGSLSVNGEGTHIIVSACCCWCLLTPSPPPHTHHHTHTSLTRARTTYPRPTRAFFSAECIKWLKEDENYYGILRIGFGQAPFRRTKWVFFTFSGPKVGVVKRTKAAGAKNHMKTALGPCSVEMQVTTVEELTLPLVIDKVKKLPGVDGACAALRVVHCHALLRTIPPPFSFTHTQTHTLRPTPAPAYCACPGESVTEANEANLDNFMKALEEEAKAAASFFGDDSAAAPTGKGRAITDVVKEIKSGKGINWALFNV